MHAVNRPRVTTACRAKHRPRRWPILVALMLGWLPSAEAEQYSLAVVPQLTPALTHRNWNPFVEQLSRQTGHRFQLRVYRTFEEFEADLGRGTPDLVYMNPYHQLRARSSQGYIALVRDGAQTLSGVLVVARDSPVKAVKDLNGLTLGFPDPNAFAASLYLRALLHEQGGIRFTEQYLTTHGNVYRHVIAGDVAAGGGVNTTLARERPETRAALRVLYETPGTAPHPLSAHPRVAAAVREAIIAAILRMRDNDAGQVLLRTIQLQKPVRADFKRDYAPLEKLHLQRYATAARRLPPQ